MRNLLILICGALSVALAACGGGGGQSSLAKNADPICTTLTSRYVQTYKTVGPVTGATQAAALVGGLHTDEQQAYNQLKGVKASSGAADYSQFLSSMNQQISILGQAQQAAQSNDPKTFNKLNTQYWTVNGQLTAAAAKAGLTACAQKLPPDQQTAVKQVVVRTGTTGDPAQCTQDFTPAYVVEQFGSPSKCVAAQKQPQSIKSVDISSIIGVSKVAAWAIAVPHGGPAGGKRFRVMLFYENGRWVINSNSPA